jgi:fucose permease
LALFLGGIQGTIFSSCLHGTGKHTKTAASILVTATAGSVPFPIIQNSLSESRTAQFAFVTILALCSAGATFSLYLNFVPVARKQVDVTSPAYGCMGRQI